MVRFTCPEFTCLCPITGQPDFAHLVIDYVPEALADREQVAEALPRLLPQPRRVPRGLHARDRAAGWKRCWRRCGCGSAATGTRAAACRSTSSTSPAHRLPASGCRTRACRPTAAAADGSAARAAAAFVAAARCSWSPVTRDMATFRSIPGLPSGMPRIRRASSCRPRPSRRCSSAIGRASFLPAGNEGPIDFYRDYVAQGQLFDGAGRLISAAVSP